LHLFVRLASTEDRYNRYAPRRCGREHDPVPDRIGADNDADPARVFAAEIASCYFSGTLSNYPSSQREKALKTVPAPAGQLPL